MSKPNTIGLGEYSDQDLLAELESRIHTVEVWSEFAIKLISTLDGYINKQKLNEKKNGFYMACGACGISTPDKVEELWDKCLKILNGGHNV